MIDYKSDEFKSLEELRVTTPSIFTQLGSKDTSDKYTHIPTDKVIADMELLGWGVVDSKEVKARKEGTIGFQKHLVVFRNPDVVIEGGDGDIVYPQVLLTNSHDGKNAFKFTAGLFRMICENGLVIATETFEDIRVRHMGYDFETLQGVIKEMVAKLPLTVESMNRMKEIELSEVQVLELAKSFLDLRIEGTNNSFDNQAINEVLTHQRDADKGMGLWEVFNRVQENIIEGNFHYKTLKGKVRQARIIKNFKQDQELNQKLFSKALEFVN